MAHNEEVKTKLQAEQQQDRLNVMERHRKHANYIITILLIALVTLLITLGVVVL